MQTTHSALPKNLFYENFNRLLLFICDDLSLGQLLELSRLSGMLLLDNFQDKVDIYVKGEKIFLRGGNVEKLPDLIPALKYADQYNTGFGKRKITDDLHEELHYGLKIIPTNDNVKSSFKSISFNLIRDIFLYDYFAWYRLPPTTKQKLDSFMIWLSENEITAEEEMEIVESFELDDFTVEELVTTVRESGLYMNETIDERVLEIFKEQGEKLQEKGTLLKNQEKLLKKKERQINRMIKGYEKIMDDQAQEIRSLKNNT